MGALIYVNAKFAETAQKIWDGILRWYETAGESSDLRAAKCR